MDLSTALYGRRATRSYTSESIDRATIERLIDAAIQAPSAMDLEPWAFAVAQGVARIKEYGSRAKEHILSSGAVAGSVGERILREPGYEMFYGAPALVVICATSQVQQAAEDCCLAAENLMLAAHAGGLATCPIGFARPWLNSPEAKREFSIPDEDEAVFCLVLGHPAQTPAPHGRRKPAVLCWLADDGAAQ